MKNIKIGIDLMNLKIDLMDDEIVKESGVEMKEKKDRKKRSGMGLKITDTDLKLWLEMAKGKWMDLSRVMMVYAALGLKRVSVIDRLGNMVSQGYLLIDTGYHGERVWLPSRKTLNLLRDRFGKEYRLLTTVSDTNYEHHRTVETIRLRFCLLGSQTISEREMLIRERRDKVRYIRRPDFILKTPGGMEVYCETELTPKSPAQYRKIRKAYEEMIDRFNAVLWIVRDAQEMERLRLKMATSKVNFLFTTKDNPGIYITRTGSEGVLT